MVMFGFLGMSFEGDDTTGLSGKDKEILARTLDIVMQDRRKNGEKLFLTFFSKYPQHMQYFKDFKDKSVEELKGNRKLIAHGSYVLGSFDTIGKNLDCPDVLVELLLKIGNSHGKNNIHTSALAVKTHLQFFKLNVFNELHLF